MILEGEDKQLVSLKNAYLGLNREKKKLLKPSEKFKNIFNFVIIHYLNSNILLGLGSNR